MLEPWVDQLEIKQYERAHFLYGGRYSHEMGLSISADTTQTSPEYDVEFQEVAGKDGDMAMDNKRLKPFVYPIRTMLQTETEDVHRAASEISRWLKRDVRYKPLQLSWDSGYIYSAIFYEQFDIEDLLPKFGRIPLNFKCHPIKYAVAGQRKMTFTNGMSVHNPEDRTAKPLIEITGSGNITLKKNGANWLILTAVDGSITIDAKTMSVYKGTAKAFDKMNANLKPMFPVFSPGDNVITWTGNMTKLEITPRWEAIV